MAITGISGAMRRTSRMTARPFVPGMSRSVTTSTIRPAALPAAAMASSPVDALMTDIRMPNVNGFELARRVVERWPATKVVYMTGYTVPATVPDAAIPGAQIVSKPFTLAKLAAVFESLWP